MTQLKVIAEFEDQLDSIWLEDPGSAAYLDALLDELIDASCVIASLNRKLPKFVPRPPIEVKLLESCIRSGRWIYIVKPYDESGSLMPYRMLLGHDPINDVYFALSLLRREISYDTRHPEFLKLCSLYDRECSRQRVGR